MVGGNKDTSRTDNGEEYECGEANECRRLSRAFFSFFSSFVVTFAAAFIRSFARTLIRSSIFFLLPFFESPLYKAIPRVPLEKSRNPLGTWTRFLADLE